MRVAFDIHTLGQRATGNETYAEGLAREFGELAADDIDFIFYRISSEQAVGGRGRRLRPSASIPRLLIAAPWALWRDRIDIAHFQYFAPPVAPCPSVLTVHDLSYVRHPEFFSPAFAGRMRALMPAQVRSAAHIITVSEATRRDLIELYGLAAERITVVHNGVSSIWRPFDGSAIQCGLARLGIHRPFILATGNLCRRKNQAALVRVYSRLAQARKIDCDLVLAGKATDSANEILAEVRRSGLVDRVHVIGYVSQQNLLALYNAAIFSVYLSRYEGFGLPILESMACGTPCLTSNTSCMPEVAGDAALLVDPNDDESIYSGLSRMIEDDTLRAALRRAGFERASRFTWRRAALETMDVYRQVFHRGSGGC